MHIVNKSHPTDLVEHVQLIFLEELHKVWRNIYTSKFTRSANLSAIILTEIFSSITQINFNYLKELTRSRLMAWRSVWCFRHIPLIGPFHHVTGRWRNNGFGLEVWSLFILPAHRHIPLIGPFYHVTRNYLFLSNTLEDSLIFIRDGKNDFCT